MNKKKHIRIVIIAAFFLASYTGVYATYFLCNIPLAVTSHDHGNHADHDQHESGDHSHNSHSSDHHNSSHGDHHGNHSHDDGAADECCNDVTDPFISLPKLSLKQFHLKFVVNYVLIVHTFLEVDKPFSEVYPRLTRYIYPPPKVPDVRVFIQSFII
ncbi:MAG: hypothetical protein WD555_05975 [Fulvivirga sp.]